MEAHRIQRSSGEGHAVKIQEDLYIPELKVSFYAITDGLMEKPIIGKVSHKEMSIEMYEDLTQVSKDIIPKRPYHIWNKGRTSLDSSEISKLDIKLRKYKELRIELKSLDTEENSQAVEEELELITNELFETIAGEYILQS